MTAPANNSILLTCKVSSYCCLPVQTRGWDRWFCPRDDLRIVGHLMMTADDSVDTSRLSKSVCILSHGIWKLTDKKRNVIRAQPWIQNRGFLQEKNISLLSATVVQYIKLSTFQLFKLSFICWHKAKYSKLYFTTDHYFQKFSTKKVKKNHYAITCHEHADMYSNTHMLHELCVRKSRNKVGKSLPCLILFFLFYWTIRCT